MEKNKIGELDRLYEVLNEIFYGGELPDKRVSIGSGVVEDGIVISGEDILNELLHEMVHIYCKENDIKETSRQGRYHNKEFNRVAASHGLIVTDEDKHDGNTRANDEALKVLSDYDFHLEGYTKVPTGKKKQSYIRLTCPSCGCSVRGLRGTMIMCANPGCMDHQMYVPDEKDGRAKKKGL